MLVCVRRVCVRWTATLPLKSPLPAAPVVWQVPSSIAEHHVPITICRKRALSPGVELLLQRP